MRTSTVEPALLEMLFTRGGGGRNTARPMGYSATDLSRSMTGRKRKLLSKVMSDRLLLIDVNNRSLFVLDYSFGIC